MPFEVRGIPPYFEVSDTRPFDPADRGQLFLYA